MNLTEIPVAEATTADTAVAVAVRTFAETLADSAVFHHFEEANKQLRADSEAQAAMLAYQQKQQSLQALLMLNAVSPAERSELERLEEVFFNQPSVTALLAAQAELRAVCQTAAAILSERIELPFAAACGPGCAC